MVDTWRYIAQRALTGELLDLDVAVTRDSLSWDLSGPGSLQGTLAPDDGAARDSSGRLIFDPWGTFIYAEKDGIIRWGGIIITSEASGDAWSIEAAGFTTYLTGVPYLADWTRNNLDPMLAVAEIWRHAQSWQGGDLGMVLDTVTTPVRLGVVKAEPYELKWYEATDCGSEFDALAKETPFDYTEIHAWTDSTRSAISHRLRLGYPRLGRRREDLAFVSGDNIISTVTVTETAADFANNALVLGKGEGRNMLSAQVPTVDGRLRRVAIYTDKTAGTTSRLVALGRAVLLQHSIVDEVTEITVIDHPNATIGSWSVGDDILVQARVPWFGVVSVWSRIVSWSLDSETQATLSISRSDRFNYGTGGTDGL